MTSGQKQSRGTYVTRAAIVEAAAVCPPAAAVGNVVPAANCTVRVVDEDLAALREHLSVL